MLVEVGQGRGVGGAPWLLQMYDSQDVIGKSEVFGTVLARFIAPPPLIQVSQTKGAT